MNRILEMASVLFGAFGLVLLVVSVALVPTSRAIGEEATAPIVPTANCDGDAICDTPERCIYLGPALDRCSQNGDTIMVGGVQVQVNDVCSITGKASRCNACTCSKYRPYHGAPWSCDCRK